MTRHALVRRLRRLKLTLGARGRLARSCVPLVEVCEFTLSHGPREVALRARARLRNARRHGGDAVSSIGRGTDLASGLSTLLSTAGQRRILVVDRMVPGDDDAGSVRMWALLRILVDLGYRVTFIADEASPDPDLSRLRALAIEVVHRRSGFELVRQHAHRFDLVVLSRAPLAEKYLPLLAGADPGPRVVFDTVDLHHLREQRLAELESDRALASAARRRRDRELALMRACDGVWVTSTHEAALLGGERALPRVDIVPLIQSVRDEVPAFAARRDLLFIGAFHHEPNEDAVLYFVDSVLPLIRTALPGVRVIVVGSHTPPSIRRLASGDVVVRGFVRDLEPVVDSCRLSVAPLRFGAGVKGKIAQSLGWGLPAVATPVAAEGMNLVDGAHILIASDAAAFARETVRLYTDEALWTRLSHAGRDLIRSQYSFEAVRDVVGAALGHTLESPRSGHRT
jgi:glycosyltransferase involved in cell wall biosynthesis